jgi:hypothetical protein
MLDLDPGARRLGEVGLGLNRGIDRFTGSILYDEKIGGTVHLALGQSYPETGGTNASALHWDLIVDLRAGGRITADGRVVMETDAGGSAEPLQETHHAPTTSWAACWPSSCWPRPPAAPGARAPTRRCATGWRNWSSGSTRRRSRRATPPRPP